jgi:hypothetical protein
MFILVESLSHTGWIRVFGGWWAAWADVGGVAGGIFLMGLIGALGCNVSVLWLGVDERGVSVVLASSWRLGWYGGCGSDRSNGKIFGTNIGCVVLLSRES